MSDARDTGLVYYGRRFYSPSQGRFLGRDPIGEKGGIHLYAFVRNRPVNTFDVIGKIDWDTLVQDADGGGGGSGLNDYLKSPGPGWGQWGYGRWGWGYYNDPRDMRPEPLDFDLVAAALDTAPTFAASSNSTLIGGAVAATTPQYKGYNILNSTDAYYGKNRIQKTFVNPNMTGFRGNGADMIAHLQLRGLDPVNAANPNAILSSLGNSKVDVLTIGTHGGPGVINMNSPLAVFSEVGSRDDFWSSLRNNLNPGATIVILGCNFGASIQNPDGTWDDTGIQAMERIAAATGATIVAPTGYYQIVTQGPTPGQLSVTGGFQIDPNGPQPPGMTPGFIVVPPPK